MGIGTPGPGNGMLYLIGGVLCLVVAVGSFVTFGGHFRPAVEERAQNAKIDLPRVDVKKQP
jgi:hypothetical protein